MQYGIAVAVAAEDLNEVITLGGAGHDEVERQAHAKPHVLLIVAHQPHVLVHQVTAHDIAEIDFVFLIQQPVACRFLAQIDGKFVEIVKMEQGSLIFSALMQFRVKAELVGIIGKMSGVGRDGSGFHLMLHGKTPNTAGDRRPSLRCKKPIFSTGKRTDLLKCANGFEK